MTEIPVQRRLLSSRLCWWLKQGPQKIYLDDLASHGLPLERSDVGDLDVLRVPLSVTVEYMIALEIRMGEPQANDPNRLDTEMRSVETPCGFDPIVKRHPAMWAAAMTEVAQKHGNGSMKQLQWPAMRIAAGVSGQRYEFEHDPRRNNWKRGYE
jgi:hypothetical protein